MKGVRGCGRWGEKVLRRWHVDRDLREAEKPPDPGDQAECTTRPDPLRKNAQGGEVCHCVPGLACRQSHKRPAGRAYGLIRERASF